MTVTLRIRPRPLPVSRQLVRAVLVALLLTLLLVPSATPPSRATDQAAARGPAVSVSPARPMVGERTVFSGSLKPRGKPVQLQVRKGNRWVTVASGRVGSGSKYQLSTRVFATATYRVKARRFTSSSVRVTVIAQLARMTASAPFVTGLTRSVTATLRPIRRGREVVLQRRADGRWFTVSVRRTDANGVAVLPVVGPTPGNRTYRVLGRSHRGSRLVGSPSQVVRTAPVTELASRGATAADESYSPSVSTNGRWVAFTSEARLRPSDTDDLNDIYLLDRRTGGLTHLLADANSHVNNPHLSGDGRFVAFQTLATNILGEPGFDYDVFVLDRTNGTLDLVSEAAAGGAANRESDVYGISDDGRFVAYTSTADNLVATSPPPNTDVVHAYLRDRTAEVNRGLDRTLGGWSTDNIFGLDISADGTRIAFDSGDETLDLSGNVDGNAVFAWTINADGTISGRTNLTPDITADSPSLSGNGDEVAFATDDALAATDVNAVRDGYLRTATGTFLHTSPVGAAGGGPGEMSADGRYVSFATKQVMLGDTNGTQADVVVWRRSTGAVTLVTRGGAGASGDDELSGDGSVLVLGSSATGLVPGTTGAYNSFVVTLR